MACASATTSQHPAALERGGADKQRKDLNWMGNVVLTQAKVVSPSSIEELQECVRAAAPPVRVLGSGHSFTPLCVCDEVGTRVSLHGLRRVWDLRSANGSASILCEGGTQLYGVHSCCPLALLMHWHANALNWQVQRSPM